MINEMNERDPCKYSGAIFLVRLILVQTGHCAISLDLNDI